MERIAPLIARKQEILRFYRSRLENPPLLLMNPEPMDTVNGAWMPTAVFDAATGITREIVQKAFASKNIDARVFFHPLSSLPMFRAKPENRVAWDIPNRAINLPSYHDLTQEELERVVLVIRKLGAS
jgi:perosamine synthetase